MASRPKVCIGQVMHETNTFSRLPTTIAAFRDREFLVGDEVASRLAHTSSEIGGFFAVGAQHNWEMIPSVAAEATPSGPVNRDAWNELLAMVLSTLRTEDVWSGVLLALHGAMVTEDDADADGSFVAAVRKAIGPRVPILVTLDLHANVSERLARSVNGIVSYRTYPHVDQFDRGVELAGMLAKSLTTGELPEVLVGRPPLLDGCDHGRTSGAVMPRLLARAAQEVGGPIWGVSVQAGFPWCDVPHVGPSVTITHVAAESQATDIAARANAQMFATRNESSLELVSVSEALRRARGVIDQGGRIVVADGSDNPGGGAYGDATNLLAAVLALDGARAGFAGIWDPEVATLAAAAGAGSKISVRLGGKTDASRGGGPLNLVADVVSVGEANFVCEGPMMAGRRLSLGLAAVLRVAATDIIVTTNRLQAADRNYFRCVGLEPTDYNLVVLKSWQHFRAAFESMADLIVIADSGGLITTEFKTLPYQRVRRPIWPLDCLSE